MFNKQNPAARWTLRLAAVAFPIALICWGAMELLAILETARGTI